MGTCLREKLRLVPFPRFQTEPVEDASLEIDGLYLESIAVHRDPAVMVGGTEEPGVGIGLGGQLDRVEKGASSSCDDEHHAFPDRVLVVMVVSAEDDVDAVLLEERGQDVVSWRVVAFDS